MEYLQSLQTRIDVQRRYLATLELRAPLSGEVLAPKVDHLVGSFISKGNELFSLGSTKERVVRFAISQEKVNSFNVDVNRPIQVLIPGRDQKLTGLITRVEPRATREIRYESLTALAGGGLTVQKKSQSGKTGTTSGFELVEPVYYLTASLNGSKERLLAGEPCMVRFSFDTPQTIWEWTYEQLNRLIRHAIRDKER